MNRTRILKHSRTTTRGGKKPYIYAVPNGTVMGSTGTVTTSTSSAPSTKTLVKSRSSRTEVMPPHWRKAVA